MIGSVPGRSEIDDVNELGPTIHVVPGHGDRILGVDGDIVVRAAEEPDDAAVEDVDGGDELHGCLPRLY